MESMPYAGYEACLSVGLSKNRSWAASLTEAGQKSTANERVRCRLSALSRRCYRYSPSLFIGLSFSGKNIAAKKIRARRAVFFVMVIGCQDTQGQLAVAPASR